jgi:hypothetical protein
MQISEKYLISGLVKIHEIRGKKSPAGFRDYRRINLIKLQPTR